MSEAGTAEPHAPAAAAEVRESAAPTNRVAELKVSGHLMTLDSGLFCVFQAPGLMAANDRSGLPGVRISLPPGPASRPEAVSISTFRNDGWMEGTGSAALIRVTEGPAQILVTVYQAPAAPPEAAPRLQVMRLGAEPGAAAQVATQPALGAVPLEEADIVAHVQRTGDTPSKIGAWAGTRGSRQWIEGFSLSAARRHQRQRRRVPGGARARLAVAVDRRRQVLRQPRHGVAAARPQGPPEGQHGEDARVQLLGHLRRWQFSRTGAGWRDLRGGDLGGSGSVPGGDPSPWRRDHWSRCAWSCAADRTGAE